MASDATKESKPVQDPDPLVLARTSLRTGLILAALFAMLTFPIHFLSTLWGVHLR